MMIKREQWIDHTFNLDIDIGWSENIMSRIKDTGIRLAHHVSQLSDEQLSLKENDQWSIKEHIGHLIDLENLWMNRFKQFENKVTTLIAADMSNTKTETSNHNNLSIHQLLSDFKKARKELMVMYQNLNENIMMHRVYHRRLNMMMRPVDLLFFIAEHDNHHITSIDSLKTKISQCYK